jgi:Putative transposase/Transposase zinc-binding domain
VDKPPFEVADVIRSLADANGVVPDLCVSTAQQRVLNAIAACRTAKLGGHVLECNAHCGHEDISYNSCRNRNCPKCQAKRRADWLEARCQDLLPVPYFHVVFTLPGLIAPLALQNQRALYGLLFSTAGDTLKEIAADPKHLGAEIGFIAVLHTWGQTLVHHPHVHCVVPGGGLSPDQRTWIASPRDFLFSVHVLSKLFRGKFIAGLRGLYKQGGLHLGGNLEALVQSDRFDLFCHKLREQDWVVYAKPPFGGPEQVLKYLARYTHRVAIANRRILSMDADTVSFRYKDYAHGSCQRVMSLSKLEFLRRFLLHVLPDGLVRIRHVGFLANRCRKGKIALCRQLLRDRGLADQNDLDAESVSNDNLVAETQDYVDDEHSSGPDDVDPIDDHRCPKCGKGEMRRSRTFDPQSSWTYNGVKPPAQDTS